MTIPFSVRQHLTTLLHPHITLFGALCAFHSFILSFIRSSKSIVSTHRAQVCSSTSIPSPSVPTTQNRHHALGRRHSIRCQLRDYRQCARLLHLAQRPSAWNLLSGHMRLASLLQHGRQHKWQHPRTGASRSRTTGL